MKSQIIYFLICCLVNVIAYGQQNNQRSNNTLQGKVLFMSSGNKPAIGVKVSGSIEHQDVAIENATSVYTTSKGAYQLTFPNAKDGYKVRLNIGQDDEYGKNIEIVNIKEVEQCRIPANASDEFEIIVCKKGARDLAAQRYYNIIKTSSDLALAETKKEMSLLLAKSEKDYTKITALGEKIKRLEQQTDSLTIYRTAYRIASVNKDKASERVLQYIEALDEGKTVQEALEFLSVELAAKEADDAIDSFSSAMEELEVCARSSTLVFDYKSAIACYDTLIQKYEKMGINPLTIANYCNAILGVIVKDGQYNQALKYGEKVIDIREEILDPKHPDLATAYGNMGSIYRFLGQYENALEFQLKDISIREEILDSKDISLIVSYDNIALTYQALRQYEKAIEFHKKAIQISEQIHPEHPKLANIYNNIASTYQNSGHYQKALEFHQKSIKIQELTTDLKHPNLANSYNNIGLTYQGLHQHEKALEFHQKAIEIMEDVLDPKHPNIAITYHNTGNAYRLLGKHQKAIEFHQKSIEIWEKIDSKHPELATVYENTGMDYFGSKNYEKALEFHQKAIRIWEKISPNKHSELANSYNNLAGSYLQLNQPKKALTFFHKAIETWEAASDPKYIDWSNSYENIAVTYQVMGKQEKVAEYQQKSINTLKKALTKNLPNHETILHILLKKYHDRAKMSFSKKEYALALEDFKNMNTYDEDSRTWIHIASCYYFLSDYPNIIIAYQKAATLSPKFKKEGFYLNNLGIAYLKNEQYLQAKAVFQEHEALFPNEAHTFHNWTVYYALQNKKDKALSNLKKAVALGYKDIKWLKTDKAMDCLRKEKAFISIIQQLEKESEK